MSNYKVSDISLWEWGRKEIVIGTLAKFLE